LLLPLDLLIILEEMIYQIISKKYIIPSLKIGIITKPRRDTLG